MDQEEQVKQVEEIVNDALDEVENVDPNKLSTGEQNAVQAIQNVTEQPTQQAADNAVSTLTEIVSNPQTMSDYVNNPLKEGEYYIKNISIKVPTFINESYLDNFDIIISACEEAFPCYIRFLMKNKYIYLLAKVAVATLGKIWLEGPCQTGKAAGYGSKKMSQNFSRGFSATKNMASRGLTNTREAASRGYSAVKNSISNRFSPKVNESQLTSIVPQPQPTNKWGIFGVGGYKKHRKNKLKTRKHKKYKSKKTRL